MRPGELRIEEQGRSGRHVLVLAGELDMAGAGDLEAAMARLCTDGASEIGLDLRRLTFIDSTGLRTILTCRELAAEHRAEFFLIPGTLPRQRRIFEVTGLLAALPFREPSESLPE